MSELAVHVWGTGEPVVLVHGSLATGIEEWEAQRPLADEGFRLVAPDRRGYGDSPTAEGEDLVRDADDIAELLDGGAHLVGHSYGALGAMLAAARHPDSIWSLALLEPPELTVAGDDPAARALADDIRSVWDEDLPDRDWLEHFLEAVGTELPPEILDEAAPLVPVLRRGRPPWDHAAPVAELAAATFPKLVVSGGHHAGFDAICDALAGQIGASRAEVTGAGHEIQFTGPPVNEVLADLWRDVT